MKNVCEIINRPVKTAQEKQMMLQMKDNNKSSQRWRHAVELYTSNQRCAVSERACCSLSAFINRLKRVVSIFQQQRMTGRKNDHSIYIFFAVQAGRPKTRGENEYAPKLATLLHNERCDVFIDAADNHYR